MINQVLNCPPQKKTETDSFVFTCIFKVTVPSMDPAKSSMESGSQLLPIPCRRRGVIYYLFFLEK